MCVKKKQVCQMRIVSVLEAKYQHLYSPYCFPSISHNTSLENLSVKDTFLKHFNFGENCYSYDLYV